MLETVTSLIGLPGAVLAVWVVLIGALYLVTRGLSRSLAWAFVAGGLVIPVAVLHVWPLASTDACSESVLNKGDSADGRYAYRILEKQCRASSELAYRVELGRKDPATKEAALRPVMRSYGFPRPVGVRQLADNHFLIFLTSNGRDQVPLLISLDPETGEPSYVHRFFQGHSDRNFTVSALPAQSKAAPARMSSKKKDCTKGERRTGSGRAAAALPESPRERNAAEPGRMVHFRFTLRNLIPSG